MEIKFSNQIKGQSAYIQCTWANCYTQPEKQRNICIRSYDRKILHKYNDTSGGIIATLTGNNYTDSHGFNWVEAQLKFCDRRETGWFRTNDIYFSAKGTKQNTADQIIVKQNSKKSASWMAWATGGFTLLKLMIG